MDVYFLIAATFILGFLGLIWQKSNAINLFVKCILLVHCVMGIYIIING